MKCVVLFIVCLLSSVSNGEIITFDSLTGLNGDPFSVTTEGNFSVTSIVGEWSEAHQNGNPIPSIFGRSKVGVVHVTENTTGLFTFTSVDLDHAFTSGPGTYSIEGLLGGASMFTTGGTMPVTFDTITSPDPFQTLDTLAITMNRGIASYNIDNVVVETVPEPTTLCLLALGGVALLRRMWD